MITALAPSVARPGLSVAGRGGAGEMRALWLPSKRFFLGTLFQPQLSSSFEHGHPIVDGFARAALAQRERVTF